MAKKQVEKKTKTTEETLEKKATGYRFKCCKCGNVCKTNYQVYKKVKEANNLDKHICRACKKTNK